VFDGLKQVDGSPPSNPEVVLRLLSQAKLPVPARTTGELQVSPADWALAAGSRPAAVRSRVMVAWGSRIGRALGSFLA
jgi:hypothetical protein